MVSGISIEISGLAKYCSRCSPDCIGRSVDPESNDEEEIGHYPTNRDCHPSDMREDVAQRLSVVDVDDRRPIARTAGAGDVDAAGAWPDPLEGRSRRYSIAAEPTMFSGARSLLVVSRGTRAFLMPIWA